MRSPQFRKHSGFIRKKTTQDSQSGSEEELSSYRAYGRPIQEAHRYVYPSLSRDHARDPAPRFERLSPSSRSSSSDFDKFDMNESLSYEFAHHRATVNKPKIAEESSFSLSPYEQSDLSDEEPEEPTRKWQPDSKKVYDHYAKNPIREESSEEQVSVEFRDKKVVEEKQWPPKTLVPAAQESSSSEEDYSPKRASQNYGLDESHEDESPQRRTKPIVKRRQSSSSSSFSLNSDSPNRQTKHKSYNSRPIQSFAGKNDKTATFNKDIKYKEPSQEQSNEELIMEYDTKQFKGGSMKERVINAYMSKEKQERQKYVNKREVPVDNRHHRQSSSREIVHQPSISRQQHQSHSQLHSNSQSQTQFNTKKSTAQLHQPSEEQSKDSYDRNHNRSLPKPQKFQMDVKVKHMSLAQAFEIRCGRLRRRLEEERQEFKHGNYAKMYKQLQSQNDFDLPNRINQPYQEPPAQRPVNKHADRMTMGIRPDVNKKEMLRVTKKKYKQLPEVKHRVNEEKKKQDLAKRMQQVKKFDREVRLRLKYGRS